MQAGGSQSCARCGWPQPAQICPICQTPRTHTPAPVAKVPGSTFSLLHAESYPALMPAFQAWKNGDCNRFVGQCLAYLGVQAQVLIEGDLSRWTFVEDSAVIYLSYHRRTNEIAIESPLIRVPNEGRVGVFRLLLELNASALDDARFCLRDDLVVLTFTDRFQSMSPPKLIEAIHEVARRADELDNPLSIAFGAPMIGPEAQRANLHPSFAGEPLKLRLPKASAAAAPAPNSAPASPAAPVAMATPAAPAPAAVPAQALGPAPGQAPAPSPAAPRPPAPAPVAASGEPDITHLLHELQTHLKALQFMSNAGATPYLLHRATVYRAAERFGGTRPDAVRMLIRHGDAFIHHACVDGEPGFPNAYAGANVYQSIQAAQGRVGPQEAPPLRPLADFDEVKALFATLLAQLESQTVSAAMQHFVLLGMVAELLCRVTLDDNQRTYLTSLARMAENEGPQPQALEALWGYIGRLR